MKTDLFDLKDKVALITGGAGYLGDAMAKGLAAHGAHVVIWARNEEKMQKLVA
ncbi:MAG: SDR family NAD(P)-dependent oxidoreductase, partial [Lentisphaeria bacterium]|nr:SDR family NAD(P)-dependent oxidoreductase [Lentisphaeria bacterium]